LAIVLDRMTQRLMVKKYKNVLNQQKRKN